MIATRTSWLIQLPELEPGCTLCIYPRGTLEIADAEAAMKKMGYNMSHYDVREHGNELLVKRWSDHNALLNHKQRKQPEF